MKKHYPVIKKKNVLSLHVFTIVTRIKQLFGQTFSLILFREIYKYEYEHEEYITEQSVLGSIFQTVAHHSEDLLLEDGGLICRLHHSVPSDKQNSSYCILVVLTICLLGYERVYLPLHKVEDTPFHIQGGVLNLKVLIMSQGSISSRTGSKKIHKILTSNG